MQGTPKPPDVDSHGGDCSETPRLLADFVRKSLGRSDDRRLRAHVRECRSCRDVYRRTMAAAARLGRGLREEREADERSTRRDELRRRAMAATRRPIGGRRFGLRLALLPAALILLFVGLTRKDDARPLVLCWSGGEVRAAGQLLGTDRPEVALESGDWCATQGNARATAGRACAEGEALLELGIDTRILVEDPEVGRIRLVSGELLVRAPWVVSSPFGVLEVGEGTGRLDLRGGRIVVECQSGRLTFTGPTRVHTLVAGERLSAGSPVEL